MALVEITNENFESTIEKENSIVVLDFWAEWCGPCKTYGPIFEAASKENPDVTFGKIDTEAQQELAGALGIRSIPTTMIFRDGIMLFEQSGALPKEALDSLLTQVKTLDMKEVHAEMEKHEAEHAHGDDDGGCCGGGCH